MQTSMKKVTWSLLVAASLLATGAQAKTYKVAIISPLTGPLSGISESAMLGANLALKDMEALLRKSGIEITFVNIDEQNPTVAGQAAKTLMADPDVIGVVGPTFSGAAMVVSDVLKAGNVPMITGTATVADLTDRNYPNVNRIVARSDAQGDVIAEYFAKRTNHRNLIVVSDGTTYGNGLADDVMAGAAKNRLIATRVNSISKTNFTETLSAIKDKQADVVYYAGTPDGAVGLLKELRGAGLNTLVAGGSTFEDVSFVRAGGPLVKGVLYTTTFGPTNLFPANQAFMNRVEKTYNKKGTIFTLYLHDAVKSMLSAVHFAAREKNGNPTRDDVVQALRKVNVPGTATGPIAFNAKGDRQVSKLFVMRFGENFHPEYVQVNSVRPKK